MGGVRVRVLIWVLWVFRVWRFRVSPPWTSGFGVQSTTDGHTSEPWDHVATLRLAALRDTIRLRTSY